MSGGSVRTNRASGKDVRNPHSSVVFERLLMSRGSAQTHRGSGEDVRNPHSSVVLASLIEEAVMFKSQYFVLKMLGFCSHNGKHLRQPKGTALARSPRG